MNVNRVAIIGSGVAGLVAVKTCIEEGLQPVCFEKTNELGGLWVSNEEIGTDPTGPAGIYKGLVTNVCKEMMAFSDFSFPRNAPPYLTREDVLRYYVRYAEHFDLVKHIQFNTTVTEVSKTPDFEETGRWSVRTQNKDGQTKAEIFDAVMVCTGLYSSGIVPNYPGQNGFKGQILHGGQFRCGQNFKDKTVVVVGAAHSAGDIAVISSDHAKKVYISLRNGAWVLPRFLGGLPTDAYANQRWKDNIPAWIFEPLIKRKLESLQDWKALGIQSSKHPANSNGIMLNDHLPIKVMSGQVVVRSGIKRFEGSQIIFDDDSCLDDVDCVIYATGYLPTTPFVKEDVIFGASGQLELYRHIMPPKLAHPTMAVIGYIRTRGALGPTAELQVRYAIKVFKREVKLSSREEMMADIKRRRDAVIKQYGVDQPKILPTRYNDELARAIGALPSFWSLLLDPKIAYHFYFGPAYPPCYRLVGSHSTPDARERMLRSGDDLIHGVELKTVRPTAFKRLEDGDKNRTIHIMLVAVCIVGFLLAVVF